MTVITTSNGTQTLKLHITALVLIVLIVRLPGLEDGLIQMGDWSSPFSYNSMLKSLNSSLNLYRDTTIGGFYDAEGGGTPFYFIRYLFYVITQHAVLAQQLSIVFGMYLSYFAMFFLLRYANFKPFSAFIAPLAFAFSVPNYNFLAFGWLWIQWQYAFIPIVILLWHKYINSDRTDVLKLTLIGFCTSLVMFGTSLLPIYLIIFSVISVQGLLSHTSDMRRKFTNIAVVGTALLIPQTHWVATRLIFPADKPNISLAQITSSFGTSANVTWRTIFTQWGTGFNQSFEIPYPLPHIFTYLIPFLALVGLLTKSKFTSLDYVMVSIFVFFAVLSLLPQKEIITVLSALTLGRDSGRLFSLTAIPIIYFFAVAVEQIPGLYKISLIKTIFPWLTLIIVSLNSFSFISPGLTPKIPPKEPALYLRADNGVTDGMKQLETYFLETEYSLPILAFPNTQIIQFDGNNPKTYHTASNQFVHLPVPFFPSIGGRSYWNDEVFNQIFNDASYFDSAIKFRNAMDIIGAHFVVFHRNTMLKSDYTKLRSLVNDPRFGGLFSNITERVFKQPESSSPILIYELKSKSEMISILPVDNIGNDKIIYFRNKPWHYVAAMRTSFAPKDFRILFKQNTDSHWNANYKQINEVPQCADSYFGINKEIEVTKLCGKELLSFYQDQSQKSTEALQMTQYVPSASVLSQFTWANEFRSLKLKANYKYVLIEFVFEPALLQRKLQIIQITFMVVIIVGLLIFRYAKYYYRNAKNRSFSA